MWSTLFGTEGDSEAGRLVASVDACDPTAIRSPDVVQDRSIRSPLSLCSYLEQQQDISVFICCLSRNNSNNKYLVYQNTRADV